MTTFICALSSNNLVKHSTDFSDRKQWIVNKTDHHNTDISNMHPRAQCKQRLQVTDEANRITASKCLEPMSHSMKSVRTNTQSLQVLEVSSLFHLNTVVGNASFFEQRCYLCQGSTSNWHQWNTAYAMHLISLHTEKSLTLALVRSNAQQCRITDLLWHNCLRAATCLSDIATSVAVIKTEEDIKFLIRQLKGVFI